MSFLVSKNQLPVAEEDKQEEEEEEDDQNKHPSLVTSHLYLKPTHSTGTLDREVVLRRIRHRKRVNKVQTAVQSLLGTPFAAKKAEGKVPTRHVRWVDDAFAAP